MTLSRFGLTPARALSMAFAVLLAAGVWATVHGLGVLAHVFPKSQPLPPAYPVWTAAHFISALTFVLLAPWQFWTTLRTRRPAIHRAMGRIAAAAAVAMGVSGIAMAFLPERPLGERVFMSAFFIAFTVFLARGVVAARTRDIEAHRAWMVRTVAVALTPLTQRLVFGAMAAAVGIEGPSAFWEIFISAMWLAWLINFVSAETWLARHAVRPNRPLPA